VADELNHLPVIQDDVEQGEPSCSPRIYISNEEASLLAEMRRLREQSKALKQRMQGAEDEERSTLQSEIDGLRARWRDLAAQREKAFVRKMIMLGHLPPNHPVER
jgi:uncharacterized protein involved in exopolysaccharide biosynthesis